MNGRELIICMLLALTLIGACAAADYRLPRSVIPSFYNITIRPYLLASDAAKQFTFDGDVSITLQAVEISVSEITLHKDYIEISDCWLYDATGQLLQTVPSTQLLYESKMDELTVSLDEKMTLQTNYTLRFKYTGQIRNGMAGLFRASYVEAGSGDIKWIGVTQLQRIDARVVFPCFDEPAFKAKFQLHISRPRIGYHAISNTRLISSEPDGDHYLDNFETTPVMSTYLVAFIVSEYSARRNSEFAVYSRPEYYNKTEFCYEVGLRTVQAYDELFQLPYRQLGNDLLQFASSPAFPHNGMENWGLIIYSEAVLVQEPGYTDGWSDKEMTIRIIAHETSHMWFGNSVTFAWWSYFWLNEAFARYYEYHMAQQLYPEYQLDQQFVVRQQQLIFGTDAVASTQPMTSVEESIKTPSQIGYKFSSIAYAKGACIVRMWRNAMGWANFDTAVSNYLKEFHLRNTEPEDLFKHLKQNWPEAQNVDLDQFFHDYTEQVGFPMVIVNASEQNRRISLQQRRFLLNPDDGSDADLRYTVPITYATNLAPNFQNLTPSSYFNRTADSMSLQFEQPIDWIVLNVQASNYYRVFYDAPLLRRLQQALATSGHSAVAVENRAQIVDDLFNYARVGLLDYADVFEFLEYLSHETEHVPWYATYEGLQRIAPRLTVEQLTDFARYLGDITGAVFAKLGVIRDSDKVLDVYNRNRQIGWLCKYQHEDCNLQVLSALTRIKQGASQPPLPDFRETFYCAAARAGDYDTVLGYYHAESYPGEQQKLWRAASCTKHYRMHYHNEILANGSTTVALKTVGLAQLYQQNPELVTPVFEMLTENITQLVEALDNSWAQTASVLSGVADYFTTREQLQLLQDFIAENGTQFGSSLATLETAVRTASGNLDWAEQRLGRLVNYLGQRSSAAAAMAAPLIYAVLQLPLLSLRLMF